MALASLFISIGAKLIKGAFFAVKGALAASSKAVFSKFIYGGVMIAANAVTSRSALSSQSGVASSPSYQNFKSTQTNPDLPLPIIYGTVKTPGNLLWQNSQEKFSQKIVAFAEGEITEFTDIRIDDIPVNTIENAKIEKYYGTDNQLIASIAPGVSQADKASNVGSLKNVAYLALTVFNDEKISSNYNLTTVIKGKKIRVYSSENTYTVQYSDNPAWVLLDFLTAYNGLGLALDDNSNVDDNLISSIFDMQSFLESAAYCDEIVNNSKRFTFNMIFDSQSTVRSLLDEIYRSCRGGLFLKNGQLQFKIDKAEHVSKIFTSDDISNEIFKAVPSEELYDIFKVIYISPAHEWQKVEAFAELPNYRNGAPVENSVSVFSCTNFEQASRLAWYYSNSKVLQPYFGSFNTDFRAYDLEVGDVIKFDSLLMGLNGYKAKVTQITDDGAGTYTVNWQTYDERLYSDQKGSLVPRVLVTKLNDLYSYPDDVRNFNVIQNSESFNFLWQLNDSSFDTYEIRCGDSWKTGKIIASDLKTNEYSAKINSKGVFCFWIKAFNGYNYSENAASDILVIQDIPEKNLIVTWDLLEKNSLFLSPNITDDRTFHNCYIYNHNLKPITDNIWFNPNNTLNQNEETENSDISEAVYAWNCWESTSSPPYVTKNNKWGTEIAEEAVFTSSVYDLGKTLESFVSLNLKTENSDSLNNKVEIQARFSLDNRSWSDFSLLNSGSYSFRYAQFRIKISCSQNQYLIVQKADISVDVPDKEQTYQAFISDAENGFYLDFSDKNFVVPPSIVATVTDNISAYAVTTDKTAVGAKIFAVLNNGQKTTAKVDLQVKGY